MLAELAPRCVQLGPQQADFALLYTDAMWEPGKPAMMAFVLSSPHLDRPCAGWTIVPDTLLQALISCKQQIGEREVIAALLAPNQKLGILRNSGVIFFCDNVADLCGSVGGHSNEEGSAVILSAFHIVMYSLGSRLWGEHVESNANMADPPSREGQAFCFTLQGGCDFSGPNYLPSA